MLEISREIYDSCQIALDIVNDLLFYDKIEDKKLILYKQKLDGCDFIEKTVRTFSLQAISKNIDLFYNHEDLVSDGVTISVNADESKFSQVIRNLVSNALKFTPQGGQVLVTSKFLPTTTLSSTPKSSQESDTYVSSTLMSWFRVLSHQFINVASFYFVTGFRISTSSVTPSVVEDYDIELGQSGGMMKGIFRVEVKDSGPGISKENQEKLFNSVIQFDTANLQGGKGSGLGLWSKFCLFMF